MEASSIRAPAAFGRPPARLLRLRTDDQLVAMFRMGNEEAFRTIHDRYRTRLLAYTRQMLAGSRNDPEDALQDVYLRAYNALRADDRPVTLRAWLYRVAHNRCIDQLRRPVANDVELFDNVHALHGPGADPAGEVQRREDLKRLIADVGRLPDQQRSALLMREMEGLSYQELAGALEVTVPAVKSLLVRARVGLLEAQEARDTACVEIRDDLTTAHDRGVRASGRTRRHLRECEGCRSYRTGLRGLGQGLGALGPSPGLWGLVARLLGIGGAGSGAAAGTGAVAGGGAAAAGGGVAVSGTVAVGTGAAAVTVSKVAAVLCCAALVGGGAVEVHKTVRAPVARAATTARAAHLPTGAPLLRRIDEAAALVPGAVARAQAEEQATLDAAPETATPVVAVPEETAGDAPPTPFADAPEDPVTDATTSTQAPTGGLMAPDDEDADETAGDVPGTGAATPVTTPSTPATGPATPVPGTTTTGASSTPSSTTVAASSSTTTSTSATTTTGAQPAPAPSSSSGSASHAATASPAPAG